MSLRFYNTLTRSSEPFETLRPGRVGMYTCGPTVYERAHVGNFRTFVWEDLLRRYLRWKGFDVTQVMNLTDIDDRTIRAAREQDRPLEEVTEPVIAAFFEDWESLGLEPVEHNPRATEHVPQMIALVRRLEAGGLTYESDGSVYFAIDRFPAYGRLANLDLRQLETGGRVEGDEEYDKDNPRDFVLWKGGQRGEEGDVASWDSPWGRGRPGWHLECSAMAMEYLGETLDIHTGGVDNIFPHHTNEAAQSEGATGRPFARYWLHAAHLLVDGAKMSKSLGNYYTLPDLVELGYRPSAIRYLLLSGHYRSQLNFTLEGVRQAERALERLSEFRGRLERLTPTDGDPMGEELARQAGQARAAFEAGLDDDLNVSEALAAVYNLVREVNTILDRGVNPPRSAVTACLDFLAGFDDVFGVLVLRARESEAASETERAWLAERIAAREAARKARDFERADRIRDEVERSGFVLEDSPEGTRWKRRAAPEREP